MTNGSLPKNGSENDRNLSLFSSSECITWLTIVITESVAIVILNSLTIAVFLRNRSLRKRSMYLVINLAVADMLVGGFSGVLAFVEMGDRMCNDWRLKVTYYSGIWHKITRRMRNVFHEASLTNLAAISLERMHATFRPFEHRVIKNWVTGVVITVTWVTAGLFPTIIARMSDKSRMSLMYSRFSFILICLFIIFVSYTSIVVKVYCGALPRHNIAASRERKLTETLSIVTLASLMTWLPRAVLRFLNFGTDIRISLPLVVYLRLRYSFLVLLFANSLVNPILYTIRVPEFRRALFSLFRRHHIGVQVQIPLRVIPGN